MDIRNWVKKARNDGFVFENVLAIRALKSVDFNINARAAFKSQIDANTKDNSIGIIWQGMDCDCSSFSYSETIDAILIKVFNRIQNRYSDAEGPLVHSFCTPKQASKFKRTSRDLALEAYENGHPWSIAY